jgi:hypothetical protein
VSFDEQGDDGQYIEIVNPWSRPVNLSGWTVRGAGAVLRLRGTLADGGLLVLTDDFNEENDPSPENQRGLGSFYAIFGKVETGSGRRIEEFSQMDLSSDFGRIELVNPQGKVVDAFVWTDGRWTGAPESFQRIDPRLRAARRVPATPLEFNLDQDGPASAVDALRIQETWANRPFASALEVMLVSAAHARPDQAATAAPAGPSRNASPNATPWTLPLIETGSADMLDARLVDCFRVGVVIPKERKIDAEWSDVESEPQLGETPLQRRLRERTADAAEVPILPACDVLFGQININTAPPSVLAALPGSGQALAARIALAREASIKGTNDVTAPTNPGQREWWAALDPLAAPAWRNLSDFIRDPILWNDLPLYERLDAMAPFYRLIATHTLAVEALTADRPNQPDNENQRTHRAVARRLLAFDRGGVETLSFAWQHNVSPLAGDPDLRSARPDATVNPSTLVADLIERHMPEGAGSARAGVTGPSPSARHSTRLNAQQAAIEALRTATQSAALETR